MLGDGGAVHSFQPVNISETAYLPWDELRYRTPPDGLDAEEWWLAVRLRRDSILRRIPLVDVHGDPFVYALPDEVIRLSEEVTKNASGQITISEQVTNHETRDRYLISSLIEEAITSSQLEGASTERRVAKEMLRSGREPVTTSERMILNNYHAMIRIGELRDEKLTPELICEIHRIVTNGTLENPAASGRFQLPGEERINVLDETDQLLHRPPLAWPGCATSRTGRPVPLTCHRFSARSPSTSCSATSTPSRTGTAEPPRAEFPAHRPGFQRPDLLLPLPPRSDQAGDRRLATTLVVQDGGSSILAAILGQVARRVQPPATRRARQRGQEPGQNYTVRSHGRSHRVSEETARKDLGQLEGRGFLLRVKTGKKFAWIPAPDIVGKLRK